MKDLQVQIKDEDIKEVLMLLKSKGYDISKFTIFSFFKILNGFFTRLILY